VDIKGQEIDVVVLNKSRFVGKTIREGEVSNSLTGQGPEMTQALMQEFFDSPKFDVCTVRTKDGNCIQFTREEGVLKVTLYSGGGLHEPTAEEDQEKST
jgi:hypothetical protein